MSVCSSLESRLNFDVCVVCFVSFCLAFAALGNSGDNTHSLVCDLDPQLGQPFSDEAQIVNIRLSKTLQLQLTPLNLLGGGS